MEKEKTNCQELQKEMRELLKYGKDFIERMRKYADASNIMTKKQEDANGKS